MDDQDDREDYGPEKRKLRISAAPAEIALMKSLPEEFRKAFALGKIVKGSYVCPEIKIDEIPWDFLFYQIKFQEKKPLPFYPGDIIKSYMLKNCTFYVAETLDRELSLSLPTTILTTFIYQKLQECIKLGVMRQYFLPFSNVLELTSDQRGTRYRQDMVKLTQELSVELILSILGS